MTQRHRSLRSAAITLALCAAVACRQGSDDRSTVGIVYTASGAYADPALFSATLTRDNVQSTIRGADLKVLGQGANSYTGSLDALPIPVGSNVTVTVHIGDASGMVTATPVSWTVRKGWNYGVTAIVARQRAVGFCVNYVQAVLLPARGETGPDSLFVVQGGLPNGALC
jgi:hypothetical protein